MDAAWSANYQQAGIHLARTSDANGYNIRYGLAYHSGWAGRNIWCDHEVGGANNDSHSVHAGLSTYLRMSRVGSTFRTWWSDTGTEGSWTEIAPANTINLSDAVRVGLFALSVGATQIPANFDYFHFVSMPAHTQVWEDYDLVYHLNEETLDGTAEQVIDSSPALNHGTSSGHPTPGYAGVVGDCILNEGSDFIQSDVSSALTGSDSRTTMLWFKPTVADQGTWAGMFSYGTSSVNTSWYMESATSNDDYYSFLLYGSAGDTYTWIAVDPAEGWNHWALSWDGTDWKGFYNGNIITNRTASPNTAASVYYIGKNRDNNVSCKGYLDEVRVATKAIDDDELKVQYLNLVEHGKLMTYLPAVVSGTLADKYGNPISGVPVKIISYDKDTLEIMDYTTVSTNGYEIGATSSGTEVLVSLSFEGSFGGDTNIAGAEFRTPTIWGG